MKICRTLLAASVMALSITSGCATFQAASDLESGRRAFLVGDNETALGYFQRAAQRAPDYVHYGTALQENVWSYVGRAEYGAGRFVQARQSLEKALLPGQDDAMRWLDGGQDMARLYLGLTLVRSDESERGLQMIGAGMRGIYDDIEYVAEHHRFSFGQFWDPRREIRSAIEADLGMLTRAKEINVTKLIGDSEWLGKRVEEEIDRARRDEVNLLNEGH